MRCLIDVSQWTADEIELAPDESHHLAQVLRARPGERLGLFTGRGHTAQAIFVAVRHKIATVRVLPETRRMAPPERAAITLIQSLPKHALMDWIIQKAVELGAHELQPFASDRVIIRLAPGAAEQRRQRWRKIALEATRQCGAAWMPDVLPVRALPEIIAGLTRFDACLVGSLHAGARPFREAAAQLRRVKHSSTEGTGAEPVIRIALVIGPEGDLTEHETAAFQAAGAQLVSFGNSVFRVETAALYGLSLLRYELQETEASNEQTSNVK